MVGIFLCVNVLNYALSENPEERTANSRESSKSNIEQSPEPMSKPDPTEPVTVRGGAGGSKGEGKGATI